MQRSLSVVACDRCMLSLRSTAACTHCTSRLCSYGCQDFACERCLWMRMQLLTRVGLSYCRRSGNAPASTIACCGPASIDDRSAQASLVRRLRTSHGARAPDMVSGSDLVRYYTLGLSKTSSSRGPSNGPVGQFLQECCTELARKISAPARQQRSLRNSLADARFRQLTTLPAAGSL